MRTRRYDPVAEKVELFAALESGALAARVVAHDSKGGNIFFENLSNKPLSVQMPPSVVMVHVLRQVGNGFGNNGNTGAGQTGQQPNQTGGGGQNVGSGFSQQSGGQVAGNGANGNGANGNGANANQGPGNGFFSIPPQRVFQLPFESVCLNYGKPDPSPRMTYQLVPVESYTDDKVLQETLSAFGYGRVNQTVIQAAAWHLANKLNWDELGALTTFAIPGVQASQMPIFSRQQLYAARELIAQAAKRVEDRARAEQQEKSKPPATPTEVRSPGAVTSK